jgi:hypothetical protein
MSDSKIRHLAHEILTLKEEEREELAEKVLPVLLLTREGLEGIDQALGALSDQELAALVDRARSRNRDVPDQTIAAVIGEALRAARATSRS